MERSLEVWDHDDAIRVILKPHVLEYPLFLLV
jgi:hypothetical protein